jgi:hypothetical protein
VTTGAFLALGLAIAFFLFFQMTKQIPALAAANASANDPYDAIGSFGIQAAAIFGLLAVARFFGWRRRGQALSLGHLFVMLRAEMATVLAVGITLAGDLMAMVRHPAVWTGQPAGREYAALLGVMLAFDAAVGLHVWLASRGVRGERIGTNRVWAGSVVVVFLVVLALYPEHLTSSIEGALVTILVGIALLVVPLRFLLVALIPTPAPSATDADAVERPARPWLQWVIVAVAGIVAGLFLVAAEMLQGSGAVVPPVRQLLLVASVYMGLETAGLLIGYAMLRRPVGDPLAASANKRFQRRA